MFFKRLTKEEYIEYQRKIETKKNLIIEKDALRRQNSYIRGINKKAKRILRVSKNPKKLEYTFNPQYTFRAELEDICKILNSKNLYLEFAYCYNDTFNYKEDWYAYIYWVIKK